MVRLLNFAEEAAFSGSHLLFKERQSHFNSADSLLS